MSEIVLHVGTHKTATTTIQDTLAANRATLAAQGLIYPAIGRTNGQHVLATHWIALAEVFRDPLPAREHWARLGAEYAGRGAGGGPTVLVSSEELSRGRPRAVDVAELRRLVEPFARKRVVCYLRNQLDCIQSVFAQIAKTRRNDGFAAFLERCLRTGFADGVFLDYGALHAHLRAGFADAEITFLSYEAAARHPLGVTGHLLEACGFAAAARAIVPLDKPSNVSPNPLALYAAAQVAAPAVPDRETVALAERVLAGLHGRALAAGAKATLFTAAEAARVADRFAGPNRAFAALPVHRAAHGEAGFPLPPLALPPGAIGRDQLTTAFWLRLARQLHARAAAAVSPAPAPAPAAAAAAAARPGLSWLRPRAAEGRRG